MPIKALTDNGTVDGITTNTDSRVLGETASSPLSSPTPKATNTTNTTNQSSNTTSNDTPVTDGATTSPIVIVGLVAGGILIIGLLLFLFFRGEDKNEENSTL